ncbi:nucleotide pyrophosphohydrolase [Candidatus Pacearchaeota archaeon]|nr:nucleotide pyrophosphohydrolase [Candidatus Pacearchaeota archaeon]
MSLEDIQRQVDEWAQTRPYWHQLSQGMRLTEEVGEVAREINHQYGEKKKRTDEAEGDLGEELVDAMFTIVCIANNSKINLHEKWKEMMDKKHYGRDKNRYEVK